MTWYHLQDTLLNDKARGKTVFLCRIRISNAISKFLLNSQARETGLGEKSTIQIHSRPDSSLTSINNLYTQFYLRALCFCPVFSESSLMRQVSHRWVPKRCSENILALKRHYSSPNSTEQKLKLHFPISSSATSGQGNGCLISSF